MNRLTRLLAAELQALLRLTTTESVVAGIRVSQAATTAVRRELEQNGRAAADRAEAIRTALTGLGVAPDLIGAAAGRATAVLQSAAAQAQPLSEALLGDLALEHQLLERARYVRSLAEVADRPSVVALAERLEQAHTETVEWIRIRLAEIAMGGPAALRPTPTQALAGLGQRVATLPLRLAFREYNRANAAVARVSDRAGGSVSGTLERAQELIDAVEEVFAAGRDAALARAEDIARDEDRPGAAARLHEVRTDAGALRPEELPVPAFDLLSAEVAVERVRGLDDADDVRTLIRYEAANKNRKGVLAAAHKRVEELAAQLESDRS